MKRLIHLINTIPGFANLILMAIRISLIFVFIFFSNGSCAQTTGDYGMFQTGTWSASSNWKTFNGSSWATSSVASTYPNNSSINVFILSGVTCTLNVSSTPCNNLTIESGAKLFTNNNPSNVYVNVYGNITCDGTIGNGITFDGISFNIEGPNCLFTGTGVVDCSRIRKNLNSNSTSNLVLDINVNLRFSSGSQTQIYNNSAGTIFNVTVNAGRILNLPAVASNVGHVSIDGLSGNGSGEMGGSYTINGTLSISGILYLLTNNSTSPCTVNIGPTGIIQAANIIANNSSAATHTLNMSPGSLLQITGTPFTNSFQLVNNNYNLSPGSTIEYSAPGVQIVDSNLTYANLKISGSGIKTAGGPIDVLGNFTITNATGAAMFDSWLNGQFIRVGGDWTDYNTSGFIEGTCMVTLNGNFNQNVTCPGGEDFSMLRINKGGGKVYLSSAPATIVRVALLLDLISGIIVTSPITSNYYLQVQTNANVWNASDISFVEGACARQLNFGPSGTFTFPIGKIGKYRPAGIQGNPQTPSIMLAEYFKADPNIVGNVNLHDPSLDHISRCEYWRLRSIGGVPASTLAVDLSWDSYSACNYGVTFLPDLRIASWAYPTANLWNDYGNSLTMGNTTKGTIESSVRLPFYSSATGTPFTLSSVSSQNPLPIKLLSFTAKPQDDRVDLRWVTSSETNNQYFAIERSIDGIEFKDISMVDGAGNSTVLQNYEDADLHPLDGLSYYRLKQTDFDGKFSYSDIVPVIFNKNGETKIFFYPNPAEDYINFYDGEKENASIKIIDAYGRMVREIIIKQFETLIDLSGLASGVYNLTVYNNEILKSTPFIKK